MTSSPTAFAEPLGHTFTYQGRIETAGQAGDGVYDLRFELYADAVADFQVGPTLVLDDVATSSGLFGVDLDFGDVFGGEVFWLEIGVRDGTSTEAFTVLAPRQRLAATPYASYALAASFSDSASSAGNADHLGGLTASQFLLTSGGTLSGDLAVTGDLTTTGAVDGSSATLGDGAETTGEHAVALGDHTTAQSYASLAIGRYNLFEGASPTDWRAIDAVFVIGNGTDDQSRSNALTVLKSGAVGIGRPDPAEALDVAGNVRASGTICGSSGCLADAVSPWTWTGDGNIYFLGKVGIGFPNPSESLQVAGNIELTGSLANAASTADGEDSVALGAGNVASGLHAVALGSSNTASGSHAVALGALTQASSGIATAMGSGTVASREAATAMGSHTTASGIYATAMGDYTTASGQGSVSTGDTTTASGNYAVSMGVMTEAQAYASLVLGRYNQVAGDSTSWVSSDPVLVVGNGNHTSRSNALTLLKNGNMTISGTLSQLSDGRLKIDVEPVKGALERLLALVPVTYRWQDDRLASGRQMGLIAQEVEAVFPELVTTDSEGLKAVRYAGLVVPLIQALQEQQREIEELRHLVECQKSEATSVTRVHGAWGCLPFIAGE